jgi:hypothetical protein
MKWIMNRVALTGMIVLAVALSCASAYAQDRVTASIKFDQYDVVYLTDFVDVRSQELNPNISGIYLNLDVSQKGVEWVCVYVQMFVQLRGETNQELMHAYTNNFRVDGSKVLAARDFAKGGSSEIYIRDNGAAYVENATLRKKLEDLASKNPTAPPGKYTVNMKVLASSRDTLRSKDMPNDNAVYGSNSQTIVVQYSTADEVFVEINDPKNGSFFNNLAPTFSWTSSAPVKVSVYEALPTHRSPQDALTGGNPSLVRQSYAEGPDYFTGTSLTYPATAERQLEQNKAFVLQVEARVITNRDPAGIFRKSLPVVFRITDDKVGQMLDNFLNTFSGSASATYSTLRAEPSNWVTWSPYGNMTLDGSTISETDLQTLINDLSGRPELKLQLGVENQ